MNTLNLFPVGLTVKGGDVWVLVLGVRAIWQRWPKPLWVRPVNRKQIRKNLPASVLEVSRHALFRALERWGLPENLSEAELEQEIWWVLRHGEWRHEKDISRCTFGGRQVVLGFCKEAAGMVVLTVYEAREDCPDFVKRFFQFKSRRKPNRSSVR
ncbi:DUF4258 domain-containing protein [Deinococcus misasensis]|uniref:DUF4258 domain-containing protein n=1 Tax=Deinococcus misasensis TaxID=392413 RepID=UPI0005514243|nr:DUF4258 domain-containing protein [Deinococcus misasensis]